MRVSVLAGCVGRPGQRFVATALFAIATMSATSALSVTDANAAARKKEARTPSKLITDQPQGNLLISVSIDKQRLKVYDETGVIGTSRISSGRDGFNTPTGVFSILEKNRHHVSNLYGASMPFMQRLTWSGIALHSGDIPGYRASHGCIRLPHSFAGDFFKATKLGVRVVVTAQEATPQSFAHPRMLKPLPAVTPVDAASADEPQAQVVQAKATSGDVADLLGVSPAQAATEPTIARPRSRAEIAEVGTRKLAALEAAMKEAETLKNAASEKAKAVIAPADDAKEALKAAIDEGKAATRKIALAEGKLRDTERKLEVLIRSIRPNMPAAKLEQIAKQETAAEDAVLASLAAVEAAKVEAAPFTSKIEAAKQASEQADKVKAEAIENVKTTVAALRTAQTALINARSREAKKNLPATVLISFKSSKVFVRQGLEPVFDAPITIAANPDQPKIGTHVLTAMAYTADGDDIEWRLVTAAPPASVADDKKTAVEGKAKRSRQRDVEETADGDLTSRNVQHLTNALARIEVPEDSAFQIAELLKPGSTIIVSDNDPSFETGKGTDIVMLTTNSYRAVSKKPRSRARSAPLTTRYYPRSGGWFFY